MSRRPVRAKRRADGSIAISARSRCCGNRGIGRNAENQTDADRNLSELRKAHAEIASTYRRVLLHRYTSSRGLRQVRTENDALLLSTPKRSPSEGRRSEERRVGKECVSTFRYRWS